MLPSCGVVAQVLHVLKPHIQSRERESLSLVRACHNERGPVTYTRQCARGSTVEDRAFCVGVDAASQQESAMTHGAHGTVELPELDDLLLQRRVLEVLAHARCVTSRQEQAVVLGRHDVTPRDGCLHRRVISHLCAARE